MQSVTSTLMLKMVALFSIGLLLSMGSMAQAEKISTSVKKETFVYAWKDTNELALDIYRSDSLSPAEKRPCVIFAFGGAFVGGHRDDTLYNRYFNELAEHHYVVASVSYRLGLRGVQHLSKFDIAPLNNAINMAVEDVYDATAWLLNRADDLGIDTSKIILSGSSSGAITVLESDYKRRNQLVVKTSLSPDFNYAGVIAFSGAILSVDWGIKYQKNPAPTMFFHGTADHIVPYNKIGFLNKGLFGSNALAKVFKKKGYPFFFYSEENLGHEVSVLPMIYDIPEILDFIQQYVVEKKPYQISLNFNDRDAKPMLTMTAEELLKKLQYERTPAIPINKTSRIRKLEQVDIPKIDSGYLALYSSSHPISQ